MAPHGMPAQPLPVLEEQHTADAGSAMCELDATKDMYYRLLTPGTYLYST